jgi:hypothetical protein
MKAGLAGGPLYSKGNAMANEAKLRPLSVRVEDDLYAAIEAAAGHERRPISNLVRNALWDKFCARHDETQPARASA